MEIYRQNFSQITIDRITQVVKDNPAISRRQLSIQVCQWLDWKSPNGEYKEASCRKSLLYLADKGVINLPESSKKKLFIATSSVDPESFFEEPKISCDLKEAGVIELVPIKSGDRKTSAIWKDMMNRFHYLKAKPLCGAQIRYLIKSSIYGLLGGISFSAASLKLRARNTLLDWSDAACHKNIHLVVNNSRFLIMPNVKIPNLASHVLSKCVTIVPKDWQERYNYSPVVFETFVDPTRYKGICYHAANWQEIGQTAGRTDGFANGKKSMGKKTILIFPLRNDWKEILKQTPEVGLGERIGIENPKRWSENEFGTIELYDNRLKERLYTLAEDFAEHPREQTPEACKGSKAKIKAAYRFFDNKRIDMQTILKPHTEASVKRIKHHKIVLAPQDTSTLQYTTHRTTKDLGPTNSRKDKSIGLLLHDTVAFTVKGTPLGVLDAQVWARNPEHIGKSKDRNKLPIEEKESFKWIKSYRAVAQVQAICPDTQLVCMGDRESDIYELFLETEKHPDGPKLLIRAERSRNRKVEQKHLWDIVSEQAIAGYNTVDVPRRGSQPAREAKLAVRFLEVKLEPPKKSRLPSITVWAVFASEVEYATDVKSPLEWMLLTTIEVINFQQAIEKLQWYTVRWCIEVYHRTLKSGCNIEERLLNTAKRIKACLAIDMVIAWRIYWLDKQARETPDAPCNDFFNEDECQILQALAATSEKNYSKTKAAHEAPLALINKITEEPCETQKNIVNKNNEALANEHVQTATTDKSEASVDIKKKAMQSEINKEKFRTTSLDNNTSGKEAIPKKSDKLRNPIFFMPTLLQAIELIASLGGWIKRRDYPYPGTTTLWRGLTRLPDMVKGYELYRSVEQINAHMYPQQRAGP